MQPWPRRGRRGETTEGGTLATFGNNRGNGMELGGGAAVVGGGEGEVYCFHFLIFMPRSKTAGTVANTIINILHGDDFWRRGRHIGSDDEGDCICRRYPNRGGISSLRMVMMGVAGWYFGQLPSSAF